MRCQACNAALSDYFATRTDERGDHLDLCGACLGVSTLAISEDSDVFKWDVGLETQEDLTINVRKGVDF